jgi:hypothetical protein
MKQLLITLLVLTATVVKSQDTLRIPYPAAKQVTKDLISGDSAKAELILTTQQLTLTEQKITFKDSIITNHIQRGIMYDKIIINQDQKFELQGKWVTQLENTNRALRAKLTFTQIISTIFVGLLVYIYAAK